MIEFSEDRITTVTITMKDIVDMLAENYPDKIPAWTGVSGQVIVKEFDQYDSTSYKTRKNVDSTTELELRIRIPSK